MEREECGNDGGISLLCVAAKIYKAIEKRIKATKEEQLRVEQIGFRKEKAFGNLKGKTIWESLEKNGINWGTIEAAKGE